MSFLNPYASCIKNIGCMAPGGNDEALVLVRPHLAEGGSNSSPTRTLKICMDDLHVPIPD